MSNTKNRDFSFQVLNTSLRRKRQKTFFFFFFFFSPIDLTCPLGLCSYHGMSFQLWTLFILSAISLPLSAITHSCCPLPLFSCFGYLPGCYLTSSWVTGAGVVRVMLPPSCFHLHKQRCILMATHPRFTSLVAVCHILSYLLLYANVLTLALFSFFGCPHTHRHLHSYFIQTNLDISVTDISAPTLSITKQK